MSESPITTSICAPNKPCASNSRNISNESSSNNHNNHFLNLTMKEDGSENMGAMSSLSADNNSSLQVQNLLKFSRQESSLDNLQNIAATYDDEKNKKLMNSTAKSSNLKNDVNKNNEICDLGELHAVDHENNNNSNNSSNSPNSNSLNNSDKENQNRTNTPNSNIDSNLPSLNNLLGSTGENMANSQNSTLELLKSFGKNHEGVNDFGLNIGFVGVVFGASSFGHLDLGISIWASQSGHLDLGIVIRASRSGHLRVHCGK